MLTILNFFIMEYTPHAWKGLEIFSYTLNIMGAVFVLAAHEHYTIDVIMAFLISSRLFLYYHTLANNMHQKGRREHKKQINYIPYIEYLEQFSDAVVPNVYEWPWELGTMKTTPTK